MREILFRGKDVYTDDWVVGYYEFGFDSGTEEPTYYIWTVNHSEKEGEIFMVDPETVGQYTGLTDKNGKKIFEGDIVKHYNNSDDGFDIGALYWDETFSQWKRTSIGNFHHRSFTYSMSRSCEYETIGNIHDNPDLLKGEQG